MNLKFIRLNALLLCSLIVGCSKRGNHDNFFATIPSIVFIVLVVGGLWFIGKLIGSKSNFSDSVLSALMLITAVAAVLSISMRSFS